MDTLKVVWIKLTPTQALDRNCKKLERAFFEFTYRFTYFMGFSTIEKSVIYDIYSVFAKFNVYMLIFSEMMTLFKESNSLNAIIDNMHVTLIHVIGVYRYKNMESNKAFYKHLASSMQSPHFDMSSKERRELVKYWVQTNKRYLKLVLFLGMGTVTVWYSSLLFILYFLFSTYRIIALCVKLIYPLVDDVPYNLILPLYIPYDYCSPTLYAITYFLILIMFNYIAFYIMLNDIIMQAYLIHLLCQYKVLENCFENILDDCLPRGFLETRRLVTSNKFKNKFIKRFDSLITQHIFLLENTMKFKESLSFPMFCQLASGGLLICFSGYQVSLAVNLSMTKFLMSVLYLGYNVFELFIFCRWCDEIKIQSENIANAVYFSKWESGVGTMPGVRSRIMLVTARAQKPLPFSAGGMSDLSLVTFTTLMKTSYSFLTVLLRFQD